MHTNQSAVRCIQDDLLVSRDLLDQAKIKRLEKHERKLLKMFLLWQFHKFFCESYSDLIQLETESYDMDTKLIQQLIREILETGNYNLDGIAFYTRIPPDVIVDAACGNNTNLSITFWRKLIDLYVQVKPDMVQKMAEKFAQVKEDRPDYGVSIILNE